MKFKTTLMATTAAVMVMVQNVKTLGDPALLFRQNGEVMHILDLVMPVQLVHKH